MRHLIIASLLGSLLSSCATLGSAARVEPASIAQYPPTGGCTEKGGAINLDCYHFPDANGLMTVPADGKALSGKITGGTITAPRFSGSTVLMTISNAKVDLAVPAYDLAVNDKAARNRLASVLMTRADDICVRDSAAIYANEAAVNGLLNIIVTGLASAGTIVTGERAKTVLAGVTSFTSGSRDHINATVYKNQVSQAVTASMAAERKRLRDLLEGRKNEGVDTFSVDDMARAANEYHQACSFYKGLELVLTSSQEYPKLAAFVNREAADREVERLRNEIEFADSRINLAGSDPNEQKKWQDIRLSQIDAYDKALAKLNGLSAGAAITPPTQ